METDQEVKELEEKLKHVTIKKISIWKRIGLLILILLVFIGGYFLKWWR